ncbi:MAG: RidA family protein [Planctomycetes bacterium]|nr:RidA family protein [Planctomycetota bacterium]
MATSVFTSEATSVFTSEATSVFTSEVTSEATSVFTSEATSVFTSEVTSVATSVFTSEATSEVTSEVRRGYDGWMSSIEEKIIDLGFSLPIAPNPVANYVPAILVGDELRTSGQIPIIDGLLLFKGTVPSEQSLDNAVQAAKICGLNAIAVAKAILDGDLERIKRVLQLRVFVASDAGFEEHSIVANGVSDLMVDIFGDSGRHTRVAMGSIGLPLGSTVEVEVIFQVHTND